jgi:protein-L-isoaspartate O-methyltransferase
LPKASYLKSELPQKRVASKVSCLESELPRKRVASKASCLESELPRKFNCSVLIVGCTGGYSTAVCKHLLIT